MLKGDGFKADQGSEALAKRLKRCRVSLGSFLRSQLILRPSAAWLFQILTWQLQSLPSPAVAGSGVFSVPGLPTRGAGKQERQEPLLFQSVRLVFACY